MVVSDAINNIMGGMESTAGVRLHNHRRKLRQRFDIIKKLGQGTYGKVQLGINKETGQEVAIKTIKKSKIETEADLVRIRREIQIMSSVQHPNIIHIYEVFENREKMVLVMEYAAGGELYDFLSERKVLVEADARRIFRQIAAAVFYCHEHSICHRDLKLENILLDETGAAKIADFGLSNVFADRRLLATFCGSPLYASPEIVRGTPYRGPEVDCWSLGVLLYTLVYGAMPFDGSNFKRLVKQISNGEYFEPKKPSPASPLIRAMLCVDPASRADITAICAHGWTNAGAAESCVELARALAAQTPVRLDLLLALAPPTDAAAGDAAAAASAPVALPRSQSVGSLMQLDKTRSAAAADPPTQRRSSAAGQENIGKDAAAAAAAKRKLEPGSSTEEASASGAKRKERTSRRRDRSAERTTERKTRSASRSKQTKAKADEPEPQPEPARVPVPVPAPAELQPVESMDVDVESKPSESKPSERVAAEPAERVETVSDRVEIKPAERAEEKPSDPEVKDDGSEATGTGAVDAVKVSPTEETKLADDAKKVKVKRKKKPADDVGSKEDVSASESSQAAAEVKAPEVKEADKAADETKPTDAEKPKTIKKTGAVKKKAEPSKPTEKPEEPAAKPMARRRSKVFESEIQKFNNPEPAADKPKKLFIAGVKVSDFKKAYERKSSVDLSANADAAEKIDKSEKSAEPEPIEEASKVSVAAKEVVKTAETPSEAVEKPAVAPAADVARLKKNAVAIIGNAIAKPPKPAAEKARPKVESPRAEMNRVLDGLKAVDGPAKKPVAAAVAEVGENARVASAEDSAQGREEPSDRPKVSSKVEITLKSATLPRRRTSTAEIRLEPPPGKPEFRSQVQHMVAAVSPTAAPAVRTQRSEVAFPVAAAQPARSMSVEPEGALKDRPKERIIPIQFAREPEDRSTAERPPLQTQRSSQSTRSGSLSRQSTLESEGGDSPGAGPGAGPGAEPIRKSPREFIIPIAVEGGGYVTPRAASVEPAADVKRKPMRFSRPLRMSSLLSEGGASDDECFSPFGTLGRHRDVDSAGIDDEFGSHMHQLRSSRPSRFPAERADSVSSGEDDDDDNFELLTAESLFSTLLSRVRNLTQRLNTDDGRPAFPAPRFMNHNFPSRSSFFSEPLSRRVSETSQFSRQSSRDRSCDRDSNHSSSTLRSGNSGSTLPRSTNSGSTLPRSANSNASLPRADPLAAKFTPSLARRLRAGLETAVTRDSSHSSLPSPRDHAPRPVSRAGSLKSGERKSRLPASFLHRSGSAVYQDDASIASEDRHGRVDSSKSYESPPRSDVYPSRYEKPYESPPRSEVYPSRYDSSKSYESLPRSEVYPSRYDSSKAYENPSRSEVYPNPYNSSRSVRSESEDRYGSSSSLSSQPYAPAPRRNFLGNNGTNSLPRRHTYRTSMSDTLDFNRPVDYVRAVDYGEQESRPPLPVRRLPRSGSYLRQRALDIAGIYSAPLPDADAAAEARSRRSVTPGPVPSDCRPGESVVEGIVRRQRSTDCVRSARPTSLDLRPTPDRSTLGKLLGRPDDGSPGGSPARSPGRRVSRFLRPDFYETPREESAYAKAKEAAGDGSKAADVANFLKGNCADLERNIATDLAAGGGGGGVARRASRKKADAAREVTMAAGCGSPLQSPTKACNGQDVVDAAFKVAANAGNNVPKENGIAKKSADAPKFPGKSEEKAPAECGVKVVEALKIVETIKTPVRPEPGKDAAKVTASKDVPIRSPEAAKTSFNGTKENGVKETGRTESDAAKAAAISIQNNVATKASPVKNAEVPKITVKQEKNSSDEVAKVKDVAVSNLPIKSPDKIPVKRMVPPVKVDKPAEPKIKVEKPAEPKAKVGDGIRDKLDAKPTNGNAATVPAPPVSENPASISVASGISNGLLGTDEAKLTKKDDGTTKLPTKIKLKKKVVKKDPDSSPKDVVDPKPKPESTNKSKFLRTLDKTIDKFEESVKKPGKLARETSLAPAEPPPPTPAVQRAVSAADCSVQPSERSPNKIKRVIDSLKTLATLPKPSPDSENSLLKRATSVDDLTNPSQTKTNQVSSMLGKFRKLEEPKRTSLLARFRKTQSVYGGSTSDGVLALDDGGDVADASCSVVVRRNSTAKTDESPGAETDVSISATVKVVKVVKEAVDEKASPAVSGGAKVGGKSEAVAANGDGEVMANGSNAGGDGSDETIEERIRRKSFYSRFNDSKRAAAAAGTKKVAAGGADEMP